MTNLTPQMIEKAKAAESVEELLAIAKAEGIEMTADEAATYFAQLNPASGELDDDELDNVAGGACAKKEQARDAKEAVRTLPCPKCGNIGCYRLIGRKKDETTFYCVKCDVISWTLAEEDNTILHTNFNHYYIMTP